MLQISLYELWLNHNFSFSSILLRKDILGYFSRFTYIETFFVAIKRSILVNCTRAFEKCTYCVSLVMVFTLHRHFHGVQALYALSDFYYLWREQH